MTPLNSTSNGSLTGNSFAGTKLSLSFKIGIGDPQYLCLDTPQSLSLKFVDLFPQLSSVAFFSIALKASSKDRPLNSQESLNKILQLQGVSFNWRKETVPNLYKRYPNNIGLVAQQVEGVVPEVMDTDTITIKGGDEKTMEIKTLQYEKLTALLIEGMKAQQQQIDSLKARVATLEAA